MFLGQLTLSSGSTIYQLSALVKAAQPLQDMSVRMLYLQSDPGNSTAKIYIGNSAVSTSNYGSLLAASGTFQVTTASSGIPLEGFYLLTDTSSTKLNVIAIEQ